ncbi:MAG: hypothetical protein H6709_10520 [Kofleriaceae bacterium]|nr:hypothetical protein [Kofleriaceae bacterium]MCB9572509.1 hypothetical protein [Kofleriaceae bacterium]
MVSPPADFADTFTLEIGETLVELVSSTYELAIDNFNRSKPYSDANTFGTDVYRFGGHKLSEAAEDNPDLITLVQEHPNFVHKIGRYEVYCHRVGKTVGADIWRSFPNPETEGVQRCTSPFLPGLEPDLNKASTVVLAHIGNPEAGLVSVHLCIPVRTGDGAVAWGHVHELYSATIAPMPAVAMPMPMPMPPPAAAPEDVAVAVVRRRPRKHGEP